MLGVPVVATDWSGSRDFLTGETACLVPAKLIPVRDPQGIYHGQHWADPDTAAAAAHLLRLRNSPDFAACLADRALTDVSARLSPAAWFESLPPTLRAAFLDRDTASAPS